MEELTIIEERLLELEELTEMKTIHKGEYGQVRQTYSRLFEYCREHNYKLVPPIIDHYLKGPGMIFRRNPKNYITEYIFLIEDNK